jgi:hypothetical protein
LFSPRQFLNRRACHRGQAAQRGVSLARAQHQFLRNAPALFVIAAVRENAAGFLQDNIQVGGGAFIQLAHDWRPHPGDCEPFLQEERAGSGISSSLQATVVAVINLNGATGGRMFGIGPSGKYSGLGGFSGLQSCLSI